MFLFGFLTQQECDDAPEDPTAAFVFLVGRADNRLQEIVRANEHEQGEINVSEARYSFFNVVVALAKAYEIEPFARYDVPRSKDFGYNDHQQFMADLDYYLTQMMVDNSVRAKRDSVVIPPKIKDNIRSYIYGLKQAVDEADFTDAKRAKLQAKLIEFETELEKGRLSLLAVTKVAFAILAVPGSLWASYDVVSKLTTNVLQAVGEAKAADDENRELPPVPKPAALLPPRREDELKTGAPALAGPGSADLDDEIPF